MTKQKTKARKQSRAKRDTGNGGDSEYAEEVVDDDEVADEGEVTDEADAEVDDKLDDEASDEVDDEATAEDDDEVTDETDDEVTDEADDEYDEEADDEYDEVADDEEGDERFVPADFEADMHGFQEELGEDWILRFSVQGGAAWLTAEKDDGSQQVEAPTASVLAEAVELLKAEGGRST